MDRLWKLAWKVSHHCQVNSQNYVIISGITVHLKLVVLNEEFALKSN